MIAGDRRRPSGTSTSSSTSCRSTTRPSRSSTPSRTPVERGVTVRVLLDHIAQPWRTRATARHARTAGRDGRAVAPDAARSSRCAASIQRPDLRNHRKLLVIDGQVAFTGSQNMIDTQLPEARQQATRAAVEGLHGALRGARSSPASTPCSSPTGTARPTSCCCARPTRSHGRSGSTTLDCQVVPSGPGLRRREQPAPVQLARLRAQERIIITSPYFVPDDSMLYAITTAAQRGARGAAVRLGDRRPVRGLPRAALLLRGAAAGGGAHLPLPVADGAARQALHDRRRGRR